MKGERQPRSFSRNSLTDKRHRDNSRSRFSRSNCTWPRATRVTTTRATRCRRRVWERQPWHSPSRATTTTPPAAPVAAVVVPWWHPVRVVTRRAVPFGTPRASSSASSASTSRYRAPCYHADTPAFAPRASASSIDARCAAARSRATSAYAARSTCRRRRRSTRASNVSRTTGLPIGSTIGTIG